MAIKKITTCIDEALWREAMLANVSWAEAMKAGIKLYVGNSLEEDGLKKRKKMLEGELRHIQDRLEAIKESHKGVLDKKKIIKKHLTLLAKASPLVMDDIKRLRAWTRRWINATHMKTTEDEFFQLCKRFKDNEFEVKK